MKKIKRLWNVAKDPSLLREGLFDYENWSGDVGMKEEKMSFLGWFLSALLVVFVGFLIAIAFI